MSKRKEGDGASNVKRKRHSDPVGTMPTSSVAGNTSGKHQFQIRTGSCIKTRKTKYKGTVGPFVRIKETGTLCFLTTRHIFGPLVKRDDDVKGMKVTMYPEDPGSKVSVCGKVIASEYSNNLDAALVEIDNSFQPDRCRFIDATEEQLRNAGFNKFNIPKYDGAPKLTDCRDISAANVRNKRVIKFGPATGLTVGTLGFEGDHVQYRNHVISCEDREKHSVEVVTYKDHFLIEPIESSTFATDEDTGASVFLVDEEDQLHCIGMVCRQMNDKKKVVVTPIQLILERLGQALKQTLEIASFTDDLYLENIDPLFKQKFENCILKGQERDRHLRINVVGFCAEGKTTLTKRLLNEPLDQISCTDGIDVRVRTCRIQEKQWESYEPENVDEEFPRRLADVIRSSEETLVKYPTDKELTTTVGADSVCEQTQLATTSQQTDKDKSAKQDSKLTYEIPLKTKYIMRKTLKHLQKKESSLREDELLATFWDFGGQFIYYATHQIFHSNDAIYLLVFDLTKDPEIVLMDYDFPDRKEKMKSSLLFWANSIAAFAGDNNAFEPKIILVGTHKDEFTGNLETQFEKIINLFSDENVKKHIYEKWFAIAATDMDDDQIDALKETIYQIGKKNAEKKKLPAKWIPLENAILEIRHKDILRFQDIIDIDAKNDYPINDETKLKMFLKYHHTKGTLIYFDEVGLCDFVVVNPQFLIDAFRCIITPRHYCRWNFKLAPELKKFTETGVLDKEFLFSIWSNAENKNHSSHKHTLLMFLERHRILAEIHKMDEENKKISPLGKYLIPIMLKEPNSRSKSVIQQFQDGKNSTRAILGLRLKNVAILSTVYERITAAALGKWPPTEFKNERLVFKNIGLYTIDARCAGKISAEEGRGIEITMLYLLKNSSPEVNNITCDRFRRYVEFVIQEEFQKHNESKADEKFTYYLRCNHQSHEGRGSTSFHDMKVFENCKAACCPDYYTDHDLVDPTAEWWLQGHTTSRCHDHNKRYLTEQELNRIAQVIGNNWQLLGISLGVNKVELEHIKHETRNDGLASTIFHMLCKWQEKCSENAHAQCLTEHLTKNNVSVDWDKFWNVIDNF